MPWTLHTTHAQAGDLAQLVGLRHKSFIVTLKPGAELHTHRGILKHDDLIGLPWGMQVFSHLGAPFFLLPPALGDLLIGTPRNTQILYPKDIGFILVSLAVGAGTRVLEAGSGSGALTTAFAYAVGPAGSVISYEVRPEFHSLARKNLERAGMADRVTLKLGDVANGFEETNVDALFLDLPNPWDYMSQARAALKPGGFFGAILPTSNQVTLLLSALRRAKFAFVEVCEIMLRYYKPEPERFRPTDRMVAHTGFLIFARRIEPAADGRGQELLNETVGEAGDEPE